VSRCLKKYGNREQRDRGYLSYSSAMADSDAVIAGLITALSAGENTAFSGGETPAGLSSLLTTCRGHRRRKDNTASQGPPPLGPFFMARSTAATLDCRSLQQDPKVVVITTHKCSFRGMWIVQCRKEA
jgi:hypothetical protein